MKEQDFLKGNLFSCCGNGAKGQNQNKTVHNNKLNQNCKKLFCDNTETGDRVREKKFRSPVFFFFGSMSSFGVGFLGISPRYCVWSLFYIFKFYTYIRA